MQGHHDHAHHVFPEKSGREQVTTEHHLFPNGARHHNGVEQRGLDHHGNCRGGETNTIHQKVDNQAKADRKGQKLQRRENALHQCPGRCVASRALRRGI